MVNIPGGFDPFHFTDPNATEHCSEFNNRIRDVCDVNTGYYCPVYTANFTTYKSKLISYVHAPQGDIANVDAISNTNCYNQTHLKICPKGYYCPNAYEKKICPAGKYCGVGYKEPNTCSWLLISCYKEGMGEQSIAVCLLMFSFMLALALWIYFKREKYVYEKTDGEMDFVTSHSEKLHQMTEEQRRTTQMLGKLSADTKEPLRSDSTPNVLGHLHLSFHESGPSRKELHDAEMLQHEKDVDTFLFSPIEEPLRISFDNLSLNVKAAPENILLNNIFGTIRPFQITALMGPSGAGKTTLLNLLRGQAHYANCFGTILVNNVPVPSLAAYRSDMAFVPQDDVVYEELTVEDNILYSAMLFNRRGLINTLDLLPMVSRAEKMVGIDFIRHSIVGGAERKGISGGQRKRVSIAMEMMKEAALFFLDEPTSGLDSATSISVLHCLKELSLLGYNIVATLHQPRQEILDLLDNLILIAPGGRLVFQGQPKKLREHFMQFGYMPSVGCNMADFMMDCLAGFVMPQGQKEHPDVKMIINELCDWWQANMQESTRSLRIGTVQHVARTEVTVVHNTAKHDLWTLFHKTCYVAASRQKKIFYRNFNVIVETCFLLGFAGMAVGFLMDPVRLKDFKSPNVVTQAITGQLVFGIFITNSGLKLFGSDELMRRREQEGGVWLLPLFIGKLMSSYAEYAFYSYAFLCGYYSVIASNSTFYYYWGIFMLLHMALYSLSNLVSIAVSGKMKDLTMLGILVVLWLFGGVQPPYPQLSKVIPVIGPIVNGCSPFRWSFQLQVVVELIWYSDIWKPIVEGVLSTYGYSHEYIFDAGMLVIYSMIVNTLAYIILTLKRDNYLVVHQTIEKIRNLFPHKPAQQPNGIQLVPLHESDTVDVRIEMREDEEEEPVEEYNESALDVEDDEHKA